MNADILDRIERLHHRLEEFGSYTDAEIVRCAIDELRSRDAKEARIFRCIEAAMGCLDPLSSNSDEKLAWYRLLDAEAGREPRGSLVAQA